MRPLYLIIIFFTVYGCNEDNIKLSKTIPSNPTEMKTKLIDVNTLKSKLSIDVAFQTLIQYEYGMSLDDEVKSIAIKYLYENSIKAQENLNQKIKNPIDDQQLLELTFLLKYIKLTDSIRDELFLILRKSKKVIQKNKHKELSPLEFIAINCIDLLYVDMKAGNKKIKKHFVELIKLEEFPYKLRVINMLLKIEDKNRRSIQMELKKVLPKNEHYLLFRK